RIAPQGGAQGPSLSREALPGRRDRELAEQVPGAGREGWRRARPSRATLWSSHRPSKRAATHETRNSIKHTCARLPKVSSEERGAAPTDIRRLQWRSPRSV